MISPKDQSLDVQLFMGNYLETLGMEKRCMWTFINYA